MQFSTRTWVLISLSCFLGAAIFWQLAERKAARDRMQRLQTPGVVAPTNPAPALPTAAPGAALPAAAVTSTVAAATAPATATVRTNDARFPHRLSNTALGLDALARSDRALLLENALIESGGPVALPIPAQLRAGAEPGAYVAQARGPLTDWHRARLAEAGARIVAYVPNNAYLVTADAAAAGRLAALPEWQAVLPWEPYFKLEPALLALAVERKPLPDEAELNVALFPGERERTLPALARLGAVVLSEERSPFGPQLAVRAAPDSLPALAALPGVQAIERRFRRAKANDLARARVKVSANTTTNVNYLGLTGAGELVNVNDTGIDSTHPDLTGRVFADTPFALSDFDGHGTHVAGIIASTGANGPMSTNVPGSRSNANFRGMAPGAALFSMPIDLLFGPFISDVYLQETAALTNALISNNSWNYPGDYRYSLASASWDAASRDALPGVIGSQPLTLVFVAGNEGFGDDNGQGGLSGTIASPGNGKNVITVGALESPRNITNVVTINGDDTQPFLGRTDSSNQVVSFSSRGNVSPGIESTAGRFKPDLVAPGSFVVSTRSANFTDPTGGSFALPTTYTNQIVPPGGTNVYTAFVPQDGILLVIQVLSNAFTTNLPSLPVLVRQAAPPPPPDVTLFSPPTVVVPVVPDTWYFAVANPNPFPVRFDLRSVVVVTNPLAGPIFQELADLNEPLGPHYRFESGTSQATPVVSGMLALMRQHLRQSFGLANPSPALMKALLINGARSAGSPYDFEVGGFINYQGWGLPNLTNSLATNLAPAQAAGSAGAAVFFEQDPAQALTTGESLTWDVTVASNALNFPLRFTLVWTDPPGNPSVGVKLVNDLDLLVSNKVTGAVYAGNDIPSGSVFNTATASNTPPEFDFVNNVENVYLNRRVSGSYAVTVRARRVNVNAVTAHPGGVAQDFALVIASENTAAASALTVTPATLQHDPAAFVTTLTNGRPLLHQRIGANSPLIVSTNGATNQWRFFVVTNSLPQPGGTNMPGTNAGTARFLAVATFLPPNLARPRETEADVDLYVTDDGTITNLSVAAIAGAFRSTGRGGRESVVLSNVVDGQPYYVGVKSEDQQGGSFSIFAVSSATPFSDMDTNGNVVAQGFPLSADIPDGSPDNPQAALLFAFVTEPFQVKNVLVTNLLFHESGGDLLGNLSHEGSAGFAVLNNHRAFSGGVEFIYDESGSPPSYAAPPDGPGSLRSFVGDQAEGFWQMTMIDNSPFQTGRVDGFTLVLEPNEEELTNGVGVVESIQPGGWEYFPVIVPADATNLSVCVSPDNGVVQVYLRRGAFPTLVTYDIFGTFAPPGGCLDLGRRDSPPLSQGLYIVGVYNPGTDPVDVRIRVFIQRDVTRGTSFAFRSNTSTDLFDDATTNSVIRVTRDGLISDVSVGVRIEHDRASDLALHLVSPSGRRVLLAENRGGPAGADYGFGTLQMNTIPVSSAGGAAAASTNIPSTTSEGTMVVDYQFYGIPDSMHVYYESNLIFDSGLVSGSGTFSVDYGPGFSTNLIIIMNEGGNPNAGTLWNYTVTLFTGYIYANFTENTNRATVPIKFAQAPFSDTNTPAPVLIPVSGFEAAVANDYIAPAAFEGWAVVTNSVSVVNDPVEAFAGNQYLALPNAVVVRTLPTIAGRRYRLGYAYRNASCLQAWWPGEGSAADLVSGNTGTLVGGTGFGAAFVGQGFNFDGVDDYVLINASSSLDVGPGPGLTIELWIRPGGTLVNRTLVEWNNSTGDPGIGAHFWVGVAGGSGGGGTASLFANLTDTAGVPHQISTGPGVVSAGAWQHVAVTYDKTSGQSRLFRNGTVVATTSLGTFTPRTSYPLYLGTRISGILAGTSEYPGQMDEIAIHGCALTPAEILSIYRAGSLGRCNGTNSTVCAPVAQVVVNGQTASVSGTDMWQQESVPFVATSNNTLLELRGDTQSILFDEFTLTELPLGLSYLPEEPLSSFYGDNAFGDWKLELWDSRVGMPAPASLLAWRLNLTFVNTNPPAVTLTNGLLWCGALGTNETAYFIVNVPLYASAVTNTVLASTNLDLLFSQFGLPTGFAPPDTLFLDNRQGGITLLTGGGWNSYDTNGMTLVGVSTIPPLQPGRRYYLGVRNRDPANSNNICIRVDFDRTDGNFIAVTPLTNNLCLTNRLSDTPDLDFYSFDAPTNTVQVTFEVSNISGGEVDLYARYGLPLPAPFFFSYASTNGGATNEIIDLVDYCTNGLAGRWYLGVHRTAGVMANYDICARYRTSVVTRFGNGGGTNDSLLGGGISYFTVDILPASCSATFNVSSTNGNVDLYTAPFGLLPVGLTPTNAPYVSTNSGTNSETILVSDVLTNSLIPGCWVIAVVNAGMGPANYSLSVTQDSANCGIVCLTNGQYFSNELALASTAHLYKFDVGTGAVQVAFETFGATNDLDLFVLKPGGNPPPAPNNFSLASTNGGATNEFVCFYASSTNALELPDPGTYFLAVYSRTSAPTPYFVRATQILSNEIVSLASGVAHCTTNRATNALTIKDGVRYFAFAVGTNAVQAIFETLLHSNDVDLYVQFGLPLTNFLAPELALTNYPYSSTNGLDTNGVTVGEFIGVLTHTAPQPLTNGVWYLAVVNRTNVTSDFCVRASEIREPDIRPLADGVTFCATNVFALEPTNGSPVIGVQFYSFEVFTAAVQVAFETFDADGDVDLYAQYGLPFTNFATFNAALTNYPYASTNLGTTNEFICVLTNTVPQPLTNGTWYLAVVNRMPTNEVAYCIRATQLLTNDITPLPDGPAVCATLDSVTNGAANQGIDYYVFTVATNAAQACFELFSLTGNADLYVQQGLPLTNFAAFNAALAPYPYASTNTYSDTNGTPAHDVICLSPDSMPVPLTPGEWHIAVVNREGTNGVGYCLRAWQILSNDIVTLTNGLELCDTVEPTNSHPAIGVNYYQFNVSTGAIQLSLETFAADGDVDIFLQYGRPITNYLAYGGGFSNCLRFTTNCPPGMTNCPNTNCPPNSTNYPYASKNGGLTNEFVCVLTNSMPVALTNGAWYLAVVNRTNVPVNFCLRAVEIVSNQVITVEKDIIYNPATTPPVPCLDRTNNFVHPGVQYFRYVVSTNAVQVNIEVLDPDDNLDLFVQGGLPITNVVNFPYSSTNGGMTNELVVVATNSTPLPLRPGELYFAVWNQSFLDGACYAVRVTEILDTDIVRLTNAIGYVTALASNTSVRDLATDFYVFNVSTGAVQTLFEVYGALEDVSLYVRRGLPVPHTNSFDYASTTLGKSDEYVFVLGSSTPVRLAPGDWFLSVVNAEPPGGTSVVYTVRATEVLSRDIVRLTNSIPQRRTVPAAGTLTNNAVDYYTYRVSPSTVQAAFKVFDADGDVDLYIRPGLPLPGTTNFAHASQTNGLSDEYILITTNSTPPLTPGFWNIAVVNRELRPTTYSICASRLEFRLDGASNGIVRLTNGVPFARAVGVTNEYLTSGVNYFLFTVSTNAVQMDFEVFNATGNVDLFVTNSLPLVMPDTWLPSSTNPGASDELITLLLTNPPPLTLAPGDYYLAVLNREAVPVSYVIRATELESNGVLRLISGVTVPDTIQPSNTVTMLCRADYYVFAVSDDAFEATFELFPTNANLDLYLRKGLPVPSSSLFDYAGTNGGGTNEFLFLTTNSMPVALSPGDWYLAVENCGTQSVAYAIRATEIRATNVVTLTNGLCHEVAAAGPGPLFIDYFLFEISSNALQANFELMPISMDPAFDADLFVRPGLPLSGLTNYPFASTNGPGTNELITLLAPPAGTNLAPGTWYVAVRRSDPTAGGYCVKVTEFILGPDSLVRLTNGLPYTNTVEVTNGMATVGIDHYVFSVPTNAIQATFETLDATGDVDLYLRRSLPLLSVPVGTNFLAASTNAGLAGELVVLVTNGLPVALEPGDWYLGIVNQTTNPVTYRVRATAFGFGDGDPASESIVRLTNAVPYAAALDAGADYYVFAVSSNAVQANFETFSTNGNVDLYLRRGLPLPYGTNFTAASTNGGTTNELVLLLTNGLPVALAPGDWYLAVVHRDTNAVSYRVRATEFTLGGDTNAATRIVRLTNGVCFSNLIAAADALNNPRTDYYVFEVPTNALRAQFELLGPGGDVNLLVRKGLPLPTLANYALASTNAGTDEESIVLYDFSAPVPLTPGDWFLAVLNTTSNPVPYCVRALAHDAYGTNLYINRLTVTTNELCVTWTNALPGVRYHVQGLQSLNNLSWGAVSPTVVAPAAEATWCAPAPMPWTIFRVAEGPAAGQPALFITFSITDAPGGMELAWFAPTNRQFEVEWSPAVEPPQWTPIPVPVTSTNGLFLFLDDGAHTGGLDAGQRFYRLRLLP